MARRVTMRDLAEHLGVNPSSVSRALNPETHHMVTPELVTRVKKAAQELGYRPNPTASALRKGRTKTVGIIIPDLMNPVFAPIIRGAQADFDRADYIAIIAYSENDVERALSEVGRMHARNVDGFLMACAFRRDRSVDFCLDHRRPLVLVNRTVDRGDVDEVLVDDPAGIRMAVRHLYGLGHRRIAHVAGPQAISSSYVRTRGFKEALRELEAAVDERLIVPAEAFNESAGRKAAADLMARECDFTAVVAANDLIALGLIDALENHGRRCPQDVSVIGFNNMPYLEWFRIQLTTIAIPHFQLGQQAARMLLDRIRDRKAPCQRLLLKPTLIVRESTRAIRAPRRATA